MKKQTVLSVAAWLIVMMAMLAVGCHDDDEKSVAERIVGEWLLDSYEFTGTDAPSVELRIERLVLTADQKFELFYPDGTSNTGTYEAGDSFLRFDYTQEGYDDVQHLLFEVAAFSDQSLTVVYRDTSGADLVATLRLRRQ